MKRFGILGILVLVVVALWSAAWFLISNEIRKNVLMLAEADGVSAPRLQCDTFTVWGFPFRFDLDCLGATLTSGDVTATLAELRGSVLVYRPTHALVFARAPLTVFDAFTGSRQRLDFAQLDASLRLDGWRIGRVSVEARDLALNDTVLGERRIADADTFALHMLDVPEAHNAGMGLATLSVFAQTEGLNAPGFAIAEGRATLEAEAKGLPDDVRRFAEQDVLRWSKDGGGLKLFSLRGDDAQGNFDVTGALSLDGSGLLNGTLDLTSQGVVERLGDLIPPQWRLLVVGNPDAAGAYRQTLNIRNGNVFSGVIPIGAIPPLL